MKAPFRWTLFVFYGAFTVLADAPPGSRGVMFRLPLVAVGELHVHAVSAEEGLAVEGRVDVGRVLDGFAHQDSAGERGLFEAAQHSWRAAGVHLQMSGAVQHLGGGGGVKRGGRITGKNCTFTSLQLSEVVYCFHSNSSVPPAEASIKSCCVN